MIDRFTAAFERIAMYPEVGERYYHPKGEFRIVTESPYVIFYKLAGEEIDIVRVLHGARRWEDLV
jgi:plasmid stabilization system protein ParE